MQQRKIIKQYLTIVRGNPQPSEGKRSCESYRIISILLIGEINIPIVERNVRGTYKMMLSPEYNDLTKLVMPKAKREHINSSTAITKYRVLDSNYGVSLVECQPITGKFQWMKIFLKTSELLTFAGKELVHFIHSKKRRFLGNPQKGFSKANRRFPGLRKRLVFFGFPILSL
jgi:hypothetical protein